MCNKNFPKVAFNRLQTAYTQLALYIKNAKTIFVKNFGLSVYEALVEHWKEAGRTGKILDLRWHLDKVASSTLKQLLRLFYRKSSLALYNVMKPDAPVRTARSISDKDFNDFVAPVKGTTELSLEQYDDEEYEEDDEVELYALECEIRGDKYVIADVAWDAFEDETE